MLDRENDSDTEVEIEIVDDTEDSTEDTSSASSDDSEKKVDEDDLSTYSDSVKKRINKLTYKTREAERREQEALEYARAVKIELDSIKKRESSLSKSLESEADTRLKTQEQLLRDQLHSAVNTGDVDKQVEAQSNLAQLAVERERLRNFKEYRQQQDAAPVQQPVIQRQPPPQPDRKAQDWAERNSWFGADKAMTYMAYEIHDELLSEGYNASGDEYYKALDSRIRKEFPQKFKETVQKKPTSNVASGRPIQVKKSSADIELSETQKTIARRLGVGYDDYKRQLKLVKERQD